ncbi:SsrA-binding protein SmpB [Reyranella sp. CPCC 100927]|uniref:SsrA-binding protein SmpB n=1 Tax=Reyranella sp. CPCC 100927 TaxID=2599616 RepID=UPI0011B62CAC|nr:SsrA-binding protein SmpB [Reyranella sp. CPCC 100927]TWT12664.1 SsrA-binding protein SmpB [Reyranella sp. CPCC 100927]
MARPVLIEGHIAAQNRKALHNYFIEERIEAGIALTGTEVKSLRGGKSNIIDAHAAVVRDELWLVNAYIPEYTQGNRFNHEPRRKRRLLLHRRQISRLTGAIQREGYTVVPLSIFFNTRGMAKVELGLAKGKKQHDKRATEKTRDWQRTRQRLLKRGE